MAEIQLTIKIPSKAKAWVIRRCRRDIMQERDRQISQEGWSDQHDDMHSGGEMLLAADLYLRAGTDQAAPLDESGVPLLWPWAAAWWKPYDRRRNLVRAGALCGAEFCRLRRLATALGIEIPNQHVEDKLTEIIRAMIEIDVKANGDG